MRVTRVVLWGAVAILAVLGGRGLWQAGGGTSSQRAAPVAAAAPVAPAAWDSEPARLAPPASGVVHEPLERPRARLPPPPPAPPRAPRPAAATSDATDDPPRELVRDLLAETFRTKLPGYELSAADYERLADAVLRMRRAQRELRRLAPSERNAAALRRSRGALTDAIAEFQEVAGLSPDEFTSLADPDVGITRDDDGGDPDPDPEYLADRRPPP